MEAGSLQERERLVAIAHELGLKDVRITDFKHIVCQMVDSGSDITTPAPEDFCPLVRTQKNEAVIFTYLDVFRSNRTYDSTNLTIRELTTPILARWMDNLNTAASGAGGIFKSPNVQQPIHLMINRPLLHVGLSDRLVGLGIAQTLTATFLEIAAVGYLVSLEIGTQFAQLESNFVGDPAAVGGAITSVNGVDATTNQQKLAPGL